jgi:hypothetical protein
MSQSIRVDYDSPFVDTSVLVASFIEGKERLYPSVAFIRKPMSPDDFERTLESGAPLKSVEFLEHCKKVICKHVDRWSFANREWVRMDEATVNKMKHQLLVAMYNITCGISPTDEPPKDWIWPEAVLLSTPEIVEGK